jgi:transcription elongation factor Elf1
MSIIHISIVETKFDCPVCSYPHVEGDWYPKLMKSKKLVIKIKCRGCARPIQVTTDIKGDVRVW